MGPGGQYKNGQEGPYSDQWSPYQEDQRGMYSAGHGVRIRRFQGDILGFKGPLLRGSRDPQSRDLLLEVSRDPYLERAAGFQGLVIKVINFRAW